MRATESSGVSKREFECDNGYMYMRGDELGESVREVKSCSGKVSKSCDTRQCSMHL